LQVAMAEQQRRGPAVRAVVGVGHPVVLGHQGGDLLGRARFGPLAASGRGTISWERGAGDGLREPVNGLASWPTDSVGRLNQRGGKNLGAGNHRASGGQRAPLLPLGVSASTRPGCLAVR
jgi:hypothetical protein